MSCKDTAIFWKSPVNIRYYSMNVQVDDGSLPFVGFEVFKRPGTVLVSILREDCRTGSVLQQVEVGFKVRVAIRVILADAMAPEMLLGSKIEAIGKHVPGGLPTGSVAGPAGGVVPSSIYLFPYLPK